MHNIAFTYRPTFIFPMRVGPTNMNKMSALTWRDEGRKHLS